MAIIDLTKENFQAEITKSDKPVLVDFYADWCNPCKMMAPTVAKLAEAYEGKVKVGKINVDEQAALAAKYKVMSIPTLIVFQKGEVYRKSVGVISEEEIAALLP